MPKPLPYINVGPDGTFKKSGSVQTTAEDIDGLLKYIKESNVKRLAIHFHGGLVSEKSGLAIALKMAPLFEGAGALPVTIVWETGLIETLRSNLGRIHETQLFRKILIWALKKAAARLGMGTEARGVGVEMTEIQIQEELKRPRPFDEMKVGEGARGGGGPVSEGDLPAIRADVAGELEGEIDQGFVLLASEPGQNDDLRKSLSEPDLAGGKGVVTTLKAAWAIAEIVVRVIRRFIKKRDHGFYPTVVEELMRAYYLADLGEWVWTSMKETARLMWADNPQALSGAARHAGRYLLEGLVDLQKETGVVIDLVGHSAGSVAICHLLKTSATFGTPLKIRSVFLLAPAVRTDVFHEEIVSHPERFRDLRVFTMADSFESRDRLAGPAYTRSLLYLISGVLEKGAFDEPIVGMERYLAGTDPYDAPLLMEVRTFLAGRVVFSKTDTPGIDGLRSESISHGAFDDDPATRASIVHWMKGA